MAFGSRVKGGFRRGSDYDALIVLDECPLSPSELNEALASILAEALFEKDVKPSLIAFSSPTSTKSIRALRHSFGRLPIGFKILYSRDGSIEGLLSQIYENTDMTYIKGGRRWILGRRGRA